MVKDYSLFRQRFTTIMCNNGKMSFVINGSNPFNKGFAGCLVNIWHTFQVNYKQLEAKNNNIKMEIYVNDMIR